MKASPNQKKKVILGLSGGVDSALAAALLKEEGYEVIARYIKGYAPPGISCPEEKDIADARRVAMGLGIDFRVVNESSEVYRSSVYEPFISEYFSGRTPNPDIYCNKLVKFPFLMRLKEEYGADFIATGHYIRRIAGRFFAARDLMKDQSYFLYAVPREILGLCLFPIGEFTKAETRRMAEERKIPVARKKGTRGVCMVGELSLPEALQYEAENQGRELEPAQAVLIKDGKEEKLGGVAGNIFLAATIGQRNGFGISYRFPIYVVNKDMKNRKLIFEIMPEGVREFRVCGLNWISPEIPDFPLKCLVKVRTPGAMKDCAVEKIDRDTLAVMLKNPDSGIAPGQSAVFYRQEKDGLEILGGGIIR